MSFKKQAIYPATPTTSRGVATKLSTSKDKVIYTNGKTVIVSADPLVLTIGFQVFFIFRYVTLMFVVYGLAACAITLIDVKEPRWCSDVLWSFPKYNSSSLLALWVLLCICRCCWE